MAIGVLTVTDINFYDNYVKTNATGLPWLLNCEHCWLASYFIEINSSYKRDYNKPVKAPFMLIHYWK